MKKEITNNSFSGGMILDLNPLVTPNTVLTNCLNGTIITYNGNEYSLLNDMGNGRVETAYLPEGYIPLGTTELGGIIYIVSYNPLIDKCLIGSFPSPERNILSDEYDENKSYNLNLSDFYKEDTDLIASSTKRLMLSEKVLNAGDKFQIYSNLSTDPEILSGITDSTLNPDLLPRYLKLNVVSIQEDGSIVKLNDSLVWQEFNETLKYYIKNADISELKNSDLDEYRKLVQSNFNVFKNTGKLAILAELECITGFDVSWDAKKDDEGNWNIYFYLNWEYENEDARDKINLYGIRVESDKNIIKEDEELSNKEDIVIHKYPKQRNLIQKDSRTDNDSLINLDTDFYTPYYVDSIESEPDYDKNGYITSLRRNDGSDNLFLLWDPIVLDKDASGIVNLTIYPTMPFGCLEYLKREITIDLDKLGTGEIKLEEFRYYYTPELITLNWGLSTHLERNKRINLIDFKFYEYSGLVATALSSANKNYINDGNIFENSIFQTRSLEGPFLTETVKQASYSGSFSNDITGLKENNLYLVEIVINYSGIDKYYYRFMYTCDIFNEYYFDTRDYITIDLSKKLEYTTNFNISNCKNTFEHAESNGRTIPNYLEIDDENKVKDFGITNKYDYTLTGTPEIKVNKYNLLFSVLGDYTLNTTNSSELICDDDYLILHRSEVTLSQENSDFKITHNVNNLNITDNNESCSEKIIKFMLRTYTPLRVYYDHDTLLNITRELVKPKSTLLWLTHWMSNTKGKHLVLSLQDRFNLEGGTDQKVPDLAVEDDKKVLNNTFDRIFPAAYRYIKEQLDIYDFIILACRAIPSNADHVDGLFIQIYNEKDNLAVHWDLSDYRSAVFVMYALKNVSGDVILCTFGGPVINMQNSKLFPLLTKVEDNKNVFWNDVLIHDYLGLDRGDLNISPSNTLYEYALAFRDVNIISEKMEEVFSNPFKIYRLEDYANNDEYRLFYSFIQYYNDYLWKLNLNIPISYLDNGNNPLAVYVNGSLLVQNINNLSYNTTYNGNLTITLLNQAHVYEYIKKLIREDLNNYVKLPDGKVIESHISSDDIFNSDGTTCEYLKTNFGYYELGITDFTTDYKIVQDEYNRIRFGFSDNKIPPDGLFNLKFGSNLRSDDYDESITIRRIYNINAHEPFESDENT